MWASLSRIVALIRKELLAVLKDNRSRMSILVPPILQCLIFGYAATYDLSNVPYAVLDQDRSIASHELLARLDGSGVFQRAANLNQATGIKTMIDAKGALLVLQIGQNFERNLLSGKPAILQVIADGRNSNTAGIAMGYVGAIVDRFNSD
jgi:ABC-2 type transport system permease protein